jgi:hypothetical protein
VTTKFPDVDDDQSLIDFGFITGSSTSSNYATHHHLKLRRLQSEIHCMLQSQHALRANASQPVDSRRGTLTITKQSGRFVSWQREMTDRLDEWRYSIPFSSESGRSSCDLMMELGYWQTIITLYRQIITIPKQLVALSSTNEAEIEQLMSQTAKEFDVVYSRVAEASQKVIRIYRALQSMGLINIAYFAEDQIFIAGRLKVVSTYIKALLMRNRFSFLGHNLELRSYSSLLGMSHPSAKDLCPLYESVQSNL